jgi:hypothetical protein
MERLIRDTTFRDGHAAGIAAQHDRIDKNAAGIRWDRFKTLTFTILASQSGRPRLL